MSQLETATIQELLVARQPILDDHQKLFAYELLHQAPADKDSPGADSEPVGSRVVLGAVLSMGLERLVAGRRAIITFDRKMLLDGDAELLPCDSVIVQIPGDVLADNEVLEACRDLKGDSYMLAMDLSVVETGDEELLDLADIVRVDFDQLSAVGRGRIAQSYCRSNVQMLATHVGTQSEFTAACRMGYSLFQGDFFSKPVIVKGKEIPGFKLNYMRVLQQINRPELDFEKISEIVKFDPSLVHKLLLYVNSASIGVRTEIRSIRHALTLLGEVETRKWFSLVAVAGLASDKPQQLMVNAVVRGRTCELLSSHVGLGNRSNEMFLMGMFSLVDAVLDRPVEEVLRDVHLADDVRDALLEKPETPAPMKGILDLASSYETADWDTIQQTAKSVSVPLDVLMNTYLEAVEWADGVFSG